MHGLTGDDEHEDGGGFGSRTSKVNTCKYKPNVLIDRERSRFQQDRETDMCVDLNELKS